VDNSAEAADAVNLPLRRSTPSKIPTGSTGKIILEDYVVTSQFISHLSPKLEAQPLPEKGGMGVFARKSIDTGELLVLWGGRIIGESELDPTMPDFSKRVLQIEEGLYLLASESLEPADRFNHSCNPNAGFSGQIGLVAMRDIMPGEEVCFDYAMCDGTPYDEFTCSCGALNCRGEVTGQDWKRPELRERYAGYYSPYLQRRIEMLTAVETGTLSLETPLGV